jgi:hypothetical protein
MKAFLLALLPVTLLSGCFAYTARTAADRYALSKEATSNWSQFARVTADKFMEEYGPPDTIEAGRLTWYGNGPWKKTEVWDAEPYYDSNGGKTDLEQTVRHHVPDDKRISLAVFGDMLKIPRSGSELIARAGSEPLNFLVINLAHEVIVGTLTPDEARLAYDRTAELSASGKSSTYMQGLVFAPEP